MSATLRNLAAPGVRVDVLGTDFAGHVRGYSEDFEQIVFNLVTNSLDALRATGGIVMVALRERETGWVQLEVTDDGSGMPVEDQVTLVHPDGDVRDSEGLGLLLVAQAVARLEGAVRVDTSRGGTRVLVDLPSTQS